MVHGHGDDIYLYGDKIKYNFSSNIVSCHDHQALMSEMLKKQVDIGRYPEPEPFSLESKIADKLGVSQDNIVVTNGATEAIYLLAQLKGGSHTMIQRPTFREYQDACSIFKHDVTFFDDIDSLSMDAETVWICNPNNPTGEIIAPERIIEKAMKINNALFIIDQAYSDYGLRKVISPEVAVSLDNIVLLGSMTKRFSIPGLRIGYAIANERISKEIKRIKMPWSVNSIAINAGIYLLEHSENYLIDASNLNREIQRISSVLSEYGITLFSKSECNFALFRLPDNVGSSGGLKKYLIEHYNVLIRDASNFEGLDNRYFRVAAQTEAENNILISGIKKYMGIWS